MLWSHMIRNDVEQNLHALLVRGGHQLLVVAQCAEMLLHAVQIHRTVTVIVLRPTILQDRRKPHRGYSKILQVWQMLAKPSQITAMIGVRSSTVVRSLSVGRLVVARVTICKAVRHDQINDVATGDPLKFVNGLAAIRERQLKGCHSRRCSNSAN